MSLRAVLLALLLSGPNTGYGLGRLLRNELSHLRSASLQQIYGELARLLADGLVDVETIPIRHGPAKRVYSITGAGEASVDEWLKGRPARLERDDLILQLYMLDRVPREVLVRNVELRLEESRRQSAMLHERFSSAPGGPGLAAEACLVRLSAEQEWCMRLLGRLRDGGAAEA